MYQSHSVADYHCNPHHALSTGDHSLRPITYLPEANLYHGRYKYTPDLIQLSLAPNPTPAASWPKYHSPVNLDALTAYLDLYPDKDFAKFIRDGFQLGFHIGYTRPRVSDLLRSRQTNHPSSSANPQVVVERITAEQTAGRLLGPLTGDQTAGLHTSPIGLVPI